MVLFELEQLIDLLINWVRVYVPLGTLTRNRSFRRRFTSRSLA